MSVADAQERVELWRQDCKGAQPRSSRDSMTPEEFVEQALAVHPHGGVQDTNGTAGLPRLRAVLAPHECDVALKCPAVVRRLARSPQCTRT